MTDTTDPDGDGWDHYVFEGVSLGKSGTLGQAVEVAKSHKSARDKRRDEERKVMNEAAKASEEIRAKELEDAYERGKRDAQATNSKPEPQE